MCNMKLDKTGEKKNINKLKPHNFQWYFTSDLGEMQVYISLSLWDFCLHASMGTGEPLWTEWSYPVNSFRLHFSKI